MRLHFAARFTLAGELIPAPTEEAAATQRAMIAEQEATQA